MTLQTLLAELDALEKKATQGPWTLVGDDADSDLAIIGPEVVKVPRCAPENAYLFRCASSPGSWPNNGDAIREDFVFVVSLVNAYRTQLREALSRAADLLEPK